MREIAAASDFDFVASEPAPAKPARASKTSRAKKAGAPNWLSRLWTWRTPLFGGIAFVGLLAAIGVNAMFLQHGRHPAPLMGSVLRIEPPKAEPAPAPAPVVRAEAKPAPSALDEVLSAPAPAPLQKPAAVKPAKPAPVMAAPLPAAKPAPVLAAPLPAAKPTPAKTVQAAPAPSAKAAAKSEVKAGGKSDAIGALMDKSAAPVPAKAVTSAQKALNKLGAHVPASGKFDDATRKAVEKFQRDNGLPVTGELTPKLRRFLALQAGQPE
ncbi:type IV secretory pathway VirB10-like protein [Rhodoblastus acidophilus]|uniref:peptidoglycan-binding domain-containing protein n=1 Tax=Rhodoblastus acidophilus TaxID=1074 RepID=UPI002225A4CB|nr:peptidoglycan-binding domain-containing protein [Rhodoblastus acidophilus]MCW2286343.1 type IV secretory pathway VirB10-like protein [Rhodoblastus acidophilus]MCW2333429.1 type IV secretory pathway VirB10-like protein [Rhodoblastus acidophilus]